MPASRLRSIQVDGKLKGGNLLQPGSVRGLGFQRNVSVGIVHWKAAFQTLC